LEDIKQRHRKEKDLDKRTRGRFVGLIDNKINKEIYKRVEDF
jgi:hypothetical protein